MSKKGKFVVNKDDLRRLMKEKSKQTNRDEKKINSPLAKYDSLGNLFCVLCNAKVKSHLVWNAHIMGRTHKETVQRLKEEQQRKLMAPPPPPPEPSKAPTRTTAPPPRAQPKSILKNATKRKATGDGSKTKSSISGLPSDFFDSPNASSTIVTPQDESSEEEEDIPVDALTDDLPSDFFDKGVKPRLTQAEREQRSKAYDAKEKKSKESNPTKNKTVETKDTEMKDINDKMAEKLPEGFFDDPKQDAKVREVEYKDKMDEEWAIFQREMQNESLLSEAMTEVESEVIQTEREIDMVDEQIYHLKKVTDLAKKKETLATKAPEGSSTNSESQLEVATVAERPNPDCDTPTTSTAQDRDSSEEESDDEEEDLGSLFWRTKESFAKK